MKILLIGCGLTGSAIATNLLRYDYIKEIALYSRTVKSAKALAFDLNNPKAMVMESLDQNKKFDYIIIALSGMSDSARMESILKRKTTFEVRQDELKYNLGAIAGLISYLEGVPKKTKIIVVTNPVDEITNYLRIMLKKENVFGFGLDLDARRYSKFLRKQVFCIGTHGKAVPIINASSEKEYDDLYKKIDSDLMSYIKRKGIPHNLAGEAFVDFFNKLVSKKKNIIHISYYLDKEFAGIKGISISLPFIVKEGKVLDIVQLDINNIEKKRFQRLSKQLKKSIDHILVAHKKLISYK